MTYWDWQIISLNRECICYTFPQATLIGLLLGGSYFPPAKVSRTKAEYTEISFKFLF